MKKILVPVDFSDVTENVIKEAVKVAAGFKAVELKIIHVAPPVAYEIRNKIDTQIQAMPGIGEIGSSIASYASYDLARHQIATQLKSEHSQLLEIKNKVEKQGINVCAFLYEGKVLDVILDQTEKYEPDMLIIGSHGHGYVHKVILGSVAVALIKTLKYPVLIVPAKN